jgi:hypothetical protein
MKKITINEDNLVAVVTYSNWIFLAVLSLLGLIFSSAAFAASIMVGGLVAIANFHWLRRILLRNLQPGDANQARRSTIARYLLRLGLLGITALLLITLFHIKVVGLIIGLSVIIVSIVFTTFCLLILKGG